MTSIATMEAFCSSQVDVSQRQPRRLVAARTIAYVRMLAFADLSALQILQANEDQLTYCRMPEVAWFDIMRYLRCKRRYGLAFGPLICTRQGKPLEETRIRRSLVVRAQAAGFGDRISPKGLIQLSYELRKDARIQRVPMPSKLPKRLPYKYTVDRLYGS